jgi:hypothetical protein
MRGAGWINSGSLAIPGSGQTCSGCLFIRPAGWRKGSQIKTFVEWERFNQTRGLYFYIIQKNIVAMCTYPFKNYICLAG